MENYMYIVFVKLWSNNDCEYVCSNIDSLKILITSFDKDDNIAKYCILHGNENFNAQNAPWFWNAFKMITKEKFFGKNEM